MELNVISFDMIGPSAAEAWNWLETHGITMISAADAPTMVSTSLESGQTLTLTGQISYFCPQYLIKIKYFSVWLLPSLSFLRLKVIGYPRSSGTIT